MAGPISGRVVVLGNDDDAGMAGGIGESGGSASDGGHGGSGGMLTRGPIMTYFGPCSFQLRSPMEGRFGLRRPRNFVRFGISPGDWLADPQTLYSFERAARGGPNEYRVGGSASQSPAGIPI